MRVPSTPRSGKVGINMTPMIDVVFQLIIFFLVSSHLTKQEVQLKLPLPTAESGQPGVEENVPRLTVNVLSDGTLTLAGRRIAAADLQLRLRDRLKDAGPGLQVRIRGDREVAYQFVEPIMLACARVGIWDVSFAVYRPEDVR
ncbi:MAG: biopolymer transporter ExbD [Planctomycetes bacterium]|nr:biopolymer transporter ExbD [Planctomycetota bacterium]